MNAQNILVIIAVVLAIASLIKPQYPLVSVSCLLLGIAMLLR